MSTDGNVSRMRQTLIAAKVGVDKLRDGLAKTRERLAAEERELETVRRRRQLAEGIGDGETVAIAERYEQVHAERVAIVHAKESAQAAELALAEREVEAMTEELELAAKGASGSSSDASASHEAESEPLAEPTRAGLADEIDALGRARARADREADVDRRLAELKRRMGK